MASDVILENIMLFYGVFLIACGIIAVIFIGLKAKTALISGGSTGCISLIISYFISQGTTVAPITGLIFPLMLFGVFSWRSTKTLFSVFKLIQNNHPDLKGKGIAFLIISLMAVVSLVIFMLQFILLRS